MASHFRDENKTNKKAHGICLESRRRIPKHQAMRQRPLSVTIFGILNIGFALLGLLAAVASSLFSPPKAVPLKNSPTPSTNNAAASNTFNIHAEVGSFSNPRYDAWQKIDRPVGAVFSVGLLSAGIGLLCLQNWARILSIIWGVYGIISSLLNGILMLGGTASMIFKIAAVIAAGLSLLYPILLLIFMFRPNVVAALKPPPPVP